MVGVASAISAWDLVVNREHEARAIKIKVETRSEESIFVISSPFLIGQAKT
jgi:hypothetical protein